MNDHLTIEGGTAGQPEELSEALKSAVEFYKSDDYKRVREEAFTGPIPREFSRWLANSLTGIDAIEDPTIRIVAVQTIGVELLTNALALLIASTTQHKDLQAATENVLEFIDTVLPESAHQKWHGIMDGLSGVPTSEASS